MLRRMLLIVWAVALLAACGQKGPLVLPEQAKQKSRPPAAHDVPPAQEQPR